MKNKPILILILLLLGISTFAQSNDKCLKTYKLNQNKKPVESELAQQIEKLTIQYNKLKPVWSIVHQQKLMGDPDVVVATDATHGHQIWYEDRQNDSDKKNQPNPKPLKSKNIPDKMTPAEAFELWKNQYPGLSLIKEVIVQDINRPVEEILPQLNEQLNGDLARKKINTILKALKDYPVLTEEVVDRLAESVHVDWMLNQLWIFETAIKESILFKNAIKRDLDFDYDELERSGKKAAEELYSLKLEEINGFVKKIVQNGELAKMELSEKLKENVSQFLSYRDLSVPLKNKDIIKVFQSLSLYFETINFGRP